MIEFIVDDFSQLTIDWVRFIFVGGVGGVIEIYLIYITVICIPPTLRASIFPEIYFFLNIIYLYVVKFELWIHTAATILISTGDGKHVHR